MRVPEGAQLRGYQKTGVRHLLRGQKKLLLDDMGLGKTLQSVVAFNTLGAKRVLIICPPAVKYGWQRECSVWNTRPYDVQVLDGRMAKIEEHEHMVIICPDSILTSPFVLDQLKEIRWSATVVDEIHRFKNMEAKRTKALMSARGIIGNSVYFWGLSGTLMPNTPKDLIVPMLTMGKQHLGKYDDWFKFTGRYCRRFKSPYGWDISGASNLGELNKRLFNTGFALMRYKDDVLSELPEKQFRLLPVKGERLSVEAKQIIKTADIDAENLGLGAGDLATLRREVGESKAQAACEYIDGLLESGKKLVVYVWHKAVADVIAEELDAECVVYTGKQTQAQKELAKQKFLAGNAQVFLANIASAGTGLDGLQHVCDHAVFVETPWTYSEVAQASDRLHRFGQQNKVLIDLLVLQNGIDHYIMDKVLTKEGYFNETFNRNQTLTGE